MSSETIFNAGGNNQDNDNKQQQEILQQIAIDTVSNLAVSEAQGLGVDPIITGALIGSDLLYEFVVEDLITERYGAVIADQMMRGIFMRGVLGTMAIWLSSRLAGDSVGTVSAAINSFVTYTLSLGINQILRL